MEAFVCLFVGAVVVSKQSDNSCNLCCESVSGATTLYVAVEPTELIENVHAKTPRNLQ